MQNGEVNSQVNQIYNSTNGITGRILITEETESKDLGMTIQFIHNGVYYDIIMISGWGITEGTPLETAQMFIDAFKE